MSQQVDIEIRLWPWSTDRSERVIPNKDLSFPYYGSPVFVVSDNVRFILPKRNEQFIPHGTLFSSLRGKYRLYEMPHAVLAARQNAHKTAIQHNLTVFSSNTTRDIQINTNFAMPQYDDGEPTELTKVVMAWSQFFDDCIDIRKRDISNNQLPWQDIYQYLTSLSGEMSEPHMALIVHIANKMRKRLIPIVRMARKILIRERTLLPVERITEMDTSCLLWYIRQPGVTMAQKAAAHHQLLMGISRKESFDTLENRVLKDFLIRCKLASQRYIAIEVGRRFQKSSRGKLVRQLQNLCSDLILDNILKDVSLLNSRVRPNYVLQNDTRYRELWKNYQRLLRQEEEEDRSWDWQARTWADIARMLLGAALMSMNSDKTQDSSTFANPLLQALMCIHKEQHLGSRILPGTEPGPFAIFADEKKDNPDWVLEVVHSEQASEHIATVELGRTGGHLFFVLERIGTSERRVIIIWAVHTASSMYNFVWEEISRSAQKSLERYDYELSAYQTHFPKLYGFVVASSLENQKIRFHRFNDGMPIFEVPAEPKRWAVGLSEMASWLRQIIKEAIK